MGEHPYLTYAEALVMIENKLSDPKDINVEMLKNEIKAGLNAFSLSPFEDYKPKKEVKFVYSSKISEPKNFCYLAPNVITTEGKTASSLYEQIDKLVKNSQKNLTKNSKIDRFSIMPIASNIMSFIIGNGAEPKKQNSKILQPEAKDKKVKELEPRKDYPRTILLYKYLSLITTLTKCKPCIQIHKQKKIKDKNVMLKFNACIIPELDLYSMIDFINLFLRIEKQMIPADSMVGKVINGKPQKPPIYRGNFPNAPRSEFLGSTALLCAIGEMVKEKDVSDLAKKVLNSLKGSNIYVIGDNKADEFTFNNAIIDLSAQGKLRIIVDSLYWSVLLKDGNRNSEENNRNDYRSFDLSVSRFLKLFNSSAFQNFLSFRAEYPETIQLLLTTYFEKMENIDIDVVSSAVVMGKWLNKASFISAVKEMDAQGKNKSKYKDNIQKYYEDVQKIKSKVLIELESSIMSAKSGDALLAQVVVRIGRLTGMDVPNGSELFMEKAASGELPLEQAKNMLMAFARLRSVRKSDDSSQNVSQYELDSEELEEYEDL